MSEAPRKKTAAEWIAEQIAIQKQQASCAHEWEHFDAPRLPKFTGLGEAFNFARAQCRACGTYLAAYPVHNGASR